MIRLFIAVNCDDETKKLLISIQNNIRAQSPKGNFSRPENLHLTLVFLGETQEEMIPAICEAIQAAMYPPIPPFALTFSQTHYREGLWAMGANQADPSFDTLKNLRRRITDGLFAAEIAYDKNKPFKPHITLGWGIRQDASAMSRTPIGQRQLEKIALAVNRVSLMKSERIKGASVYTEIFGQTL